MSDIPYLIYFPKIGDDTNGYISVCENKALPFLPKRVYWTYFVPEDVKRGGHAHIELQQILFAITGIIEIKIETLDGIKHTFILDRPDLGVFIPKMSWRTMKYSENAIQVCIASMEYIEDDYIRDYERFNTLKK